MTALLAENPQLADESLRARIGLGTLTGEPEETPLFVLPGDEEVAIEVAEILLRFGADPTHRNRAGQTAVD